MGHYREKNPAVYEFLNDFRENIGKIQEGFKHPHKRDKHLEALASLKVLQAVKRDQGDSNSTLHEILKDYKNILPSNMTHWFSVLYQAGVRFQ